MIRAALGSRACNQEKNAAAEFSRFRTMPPAPQSPCGRDGGWAAIAAALTEGRRMEKILTLLILVLEIVKRLLDLLMH
ncbi:hypothetical protein [Azospirillum picis]|uniref:Uncharacterized protein n=1 Tax=Azospirillum picis TaxID=488438 RepID=A0ABU0MDC5_9PROT|nr:hypothetical protein [Azospirillum picis]MBP2297568.1 hypothetical protein [Azospirillum picis]MDQ0531409.1 hypothetical protein [Azospirillum picis]